MRRRHACLHTPRPRNSPHGGGGREGHSHNGNTSVIIIGLLATHPSLPPAAAGGKSPSSWSHHLQTCAAALFCGAAVSSASAVLRPPPPRNVWFGRDPLSRPVRPCSSVAAFSVVVPVIYHDPLCARIHFKRRLQLWCIVHSLCAGLDQTGRLRTRGLTG